MAPRSDEGSERRSPETIMTKKKMVFVAAMLLLLPSIAFATAVTYSTSGSVSVSFVTYKGLTNKHIPAPKIPDATAPFGTLKIKCKSSSCPATGATLTVTIHQTLPSPGGTGTVTATLSGVFSKKAGGTLMVTWTSPPVTINSGGVATTYTPLPASITCSSGTCSLKLLVSITQKKLVTPEPTAQLLLGLGMLGLMGLATVSRKMIST